MWWTNTLRTSAEDPGTLAENEPPQLKNTCEQFKLSFNQILPTLFTLRDDESRIIAVMSSNVDDLLHGYLLVGAEVTNCVLQQFLVGKEERGIFRFCGKEFRQDDDFGIHVTAKDNTERVQPIIYDVKHGLTRRATAEEIHQVRSVTRSLGWIARQTRPDLSYCISKIQSTFEIACVRDLRDCNKSCRVCNIYVHAWHLFSPDFSWDDALVVTISVTPVPAKNRSKSTESLRTSNHNRLVSQLWLQVTRLNAVKMLIHPLSWSSTRIRRVCRSTLMAEAYALSKAVEHGLRTGATIVDMRGLLNSRQWEETVSAVMVRRIAKASILI